MCERIADCHIERQDRAENEVVRITECAAAGVWYTLNNMSSSTTSREAALA